MLPTKETMVITTDGRVVKGDVTTSFAMNGELKSFTLKDSTGAKIKFKAEEVLEVRAKLTALAKLGAVSMNMDGGSGISGTVMSVINASKDDIWKKDLIIYYQVETRPGKFALLQLLNPGENTVISVYPAPNTQGTDTETQYYYAVKGKQVTKVVKKDYDKEIYPALFSDCPAYINEYAVQKGRTIDEFPGHVTKYNAACAPK